jgi:ParB-like chromosome segregation protein Spo0J
MSEPKIVMRKVAEIKPYPQNAKVHSLAQVQKVAASIREFGFNQPIVVDKKGVIIVGHGRFIAATEVLGLEVVPVLEIDITEKQARAYRLADNKLNQSEWDMKIVVAELKDLSESMVDLTGFEKSEIEAQIKNDEINDLSKERDVDLGKYKVCTVEAPQAPRLKSRCSFYTESIEDFEEIKKYFHENEGELDISKLLGLIRK